MNASHRGPVWEVAISSRGEWVASTGWSGDATVLVWNLRTGEWIRELTYTDVNDKDFSAHLHVSPDGQHLVIEAHNNSLWDALHGQHLTTLYAHPEPTNGPFFLLEDMPTERCAWSPDGSTLAFADFTRTLRIMNVEEEEYPFVLSHACEGIISHIVFSPGGRWLLWRDDCYDDGTQLHALDWSSCNDPMRMIVRKEFPISKNAAIAFEDECTLVVVGGDRSSDCITDRDRWDLETGTCLEHYEHPAEHPGGTTSDYTLTLDGRRLCWVEKDPLGVTPPLVCVADTKTRSLLWSQHVAGLSVYDGYRRHGPLISPNGEYVATSSKDRAMQLWRVLDGECIAMNSYPGKGPAINRFSEDGQILVTGANDGTVSILRISDYDH